MMKVFNVKGIIILIVLVTGIDLAVAFGLSGWITSVVRSEAAKKINGFVEIDTVRIHPALLSLSVKGVDLKDEKSRSVFTGDASLRLSFGDALRKRIGFSHITLSDFELGVEDSKDSNTMQTLLKSDEEKKKSIFKLPENTDWFSRTFKKLKPEDKEEEDKKSDDDKVKKEPQIEKISAGRKITFPGRHAYQFKITSLKLNNGRIKLTSEGKTLPPLADIHLHLKNLVVMNDSSTAFDEVKFNATTRTADEGSIKTLVKKKNDKTVIDADLTDFDLAAYAPLYEKSLPVKFEAGLLTATTKGDFTKEVLNIRQTIKLRKHRIRPGIGGSILGAIGVDGITDVLNRRESLELAFNIGGSPSKPNWSGFHTTLMDMVGEELKESGFGAIKEKAKDEFSNLKGKLQDLF